MEKLILSLNPEQQMKIAELAKEENVSVSEIAKRAIDAYDPVDEAVAELISVVIADTCNDIAQQINEITKKIQKTIDQLSLPFEEKKRIYAIEDFEKLYK